MPSAMSFCRLLKERHCMWTMEGLPQDGAGIFQHQKDLVKVKHCHLKYERVRLLQEQLAQNLLDNMH